MDTTPNGQADLVTISINPARFKKFFGRILHHWFLWLSILTAVIVYVVYRDSVWASIQRAGSQQVSQPEQNQPLFNNMIVAPKGNVTGAGFTVPVSRQVHITVKGSTASRLLINKLDDPVVRRTFTQSDMGVSCNQSSH